MVSRHLLARLSMRPGYQERLEAIGLLPHENDEFIVEALEHFLHRLENTPIKAVVADYDGTLCAPP